MDNNISHVIYVLNV